MKKKNRKRAATIAALSCIAILLGIFVLSDNDDTEIHSINVVPTATPAPAATDTISQTPALTPQSSPSWTPPEKTTSPIDRPKLKMAISLPLLLKEKTYLSRMASMRIL